MRRPVIAAVLGVCMLALAGPAAGQARQGGGRAFGAPPADQPAPAAPPSPASAQGERPRGSPGGSTAQGRGVSVAAAEAELRAAEQEPGPPARTLTRPLITLGWAYWRAGREREAIATLQRVLEIHEGLRQPNRPVLGRILSDLGYFLSQTGRTGEAAQMLERALPIVDSEPSLQSDSYVAAQTWSTLGTIRILQGRTREGQALHARAVTAREALVRSLTAQNAPPADIANAYNRLSRSYAGVSRLQDAIDAAQRSVALVESAGPSVELAQGLIDLGFALRIAGRNADAEAALVRAAEVAQRASGAASPLYGRALMNLGRAQNEGGRLRLAEETLQRALTVQQRASGESFDTALVLTYWSQVATSRRAYAEAEQRAQQAIAIMQRRFGPNHPNVASPLAGLARSYRLQGRLSEAEQMMVRAVAIVERGYGPEHVWTSQFRADLARILIAQSRYVEALPIMTRTVASLERTNPGSRIQGLALLNLALVQRGLDRLPDAEATSRRALAILQASLAPNAPSLGDATMILGRTLRAQGKLDEAAAEFRRAIELYERGMGPEFPDRAWALNGLADVQLARGEIDAALATVRTATAVLRQRSQAGSAAREQEETGERLSFRQVFIDHVRIAQRAIAADSAQGDVLTAEAFTAAQQAQAGGTAAALARMADRFAAGDDGLAQRLRERGDLVERVGAVDRQLSEALASPGGTAAAARLRTELAAGRRALVELDRRIAREFPTYRRLIGSDAAGLAEIQRALGTDEALLDYVIGARETFLFVVRRERAALLRLGVGAADLARLVRTLRQGVNPDAVTSLETLPRFDLAAAHQLYQAILAPAMPALDGVGHVFIVADRALQSLPFSLLVTAPPAAAGGPAAWRQAAWLARRLATSTLPSASALRALRELARPSRAPEPFIGFGDPALNGPPASTRGGARAIDAAQLFLRSGQPNLRAIRELSPLPETADELRALARLLGAADSALFLRDQATVRRVRAAPLANYRVVAFATLGITAGELGDRGEPGLVLTPPQAASTDDDGILSASEIAALRLDADWVILSACNTAAPDGTPGAEALSGLARAFFYAGSRALLVSHWAVASEAAQQLTTGTFAALAREPGLGRAEGLRRAMLAMIDGDQAYMAHPLFWAPFVVVGEGGRAIAVAPEAAEDP